MMSKGKEHQNELIQRGVKQPNALGTGLFVGLRSFDISLQYGILARGLGASSLHKVGFKTLDQGPPIVTGLRLLDNLGLSPYRLILFGMGVGSAIKQIYWLLGISQEEFLPASAVVVSIFNTVFNSLNSVLFIGQLTSASANGEHFPQTPLIAGSALYAVGILTETFSEWQRKQFKNDSANKGKVYNGGLFSLARHINYGGYTLWRTGYALACGGWTWGAMTAGFFTYNFISGGIPELDLYCSERVSPSTARSPDTS